MTTPTAGSRVRPRAGWYLLVALLWIASLVVGGTVIATVVNVIDHGVTSFQAGQHIPVPQSGLTIYARSRPQSDTCTLTDQTGASTSMEGLGYDLNATFNGVTVYAVAATPDGIAPGSYAISCPGIGTGELYYGEKFPLGSILVRVGISALLGLAGLVLLIVLLIRRHTSKSRIRSQRPMNTAGYGTGQPPGWGGPPVGSYGQPVEQYPNQPPYGAQHPPPPPYGGQYPPQAGQPPPPPDTGGAPSARGD